MFANNAQQRPGCFRSDAKRFADIDDPIHQGLCRALDRCRGGLLQLRVGQPKIAGDGIIAGVFAGRDAAWPGIYFPVAQSERRMRGDNGQKGRRRQATPMRSPHHRFVAALPGTTQGSDDDKAEHGDSLPARQ
ncbi:hypothetical protein [Bradyrhizobium sp.]|uniref:hypothetical protein n=1 Tax=Bradyrhizobium sp. TaxID=376 RepID=UPI003C6FA3AA